MNHDDIIALVGLGIKLFSDASKASHDHSHHLLNQDNLAVSRDLVQVGQKLYKIGSDAQRSRASRPAFTSTWIRNDGTEMGVGYNKESGAVALSFPRADGNGYNVYVGGGEVYSNSIAIIVSGYNSRTGDFLIIQGISDNGYTITLRNWTQGYDEIEYDGPFRRVSEWSYDYY